MSRASGYGSCNGTILAVASNGNNQIVGFTYDGAGNTTNDGINTYTWDGESQLASAAGVNYSYDGDGRRVAKVGSKFYWYGSGDEILAETDDSGNTLNEYVFFGGRRVAVLPSTGGPLYYGSDMLGTSRVMVEANGTLCYDADFTPFGAEVPYTSNCSQNYKFEGKERDTETANDYFGARYYSSHFGRWLSADWSSVPAPVPYANLTNPQTLNLYSMVSDDPESFADLDGHENTTPAWERSDGQPNSCKGPTPDDCGAGTTQPNPQAQQTTTPASSTMPFPTTIELPDARGKILTTTLSAAADLLSSAVVESVGAAAYLVSPGTGGVTQEFPTAITPRGFARKHEHFDSCFDFSAGCCKCLSPYKQSTRDAMVQMRNQTTSTLNLDRVGRLRRIGRNPGSSRGHRPVHKTERTNPADSAKPISLWEG